MFLDGMPAATSAELDVLEASIDGWLATALADNDALVAVDRGEPGERRWYVRMKGEEKDFTTVWLTLGQRALHAETYVMPAPEENEAEFYAHLLRRNRAARGLWFCIGDEDALYLMGQVPLALIDEANLDRVLGSAYRYVEDWFRPALRIGYASRFK
ncbi:MAG: type III secretion system chaperone [Acidobacteria bacterium]|nr:type III secretion system chaperone [Acidobacteriota bacterium]